MVKKVAEFQASDLFKWIGEVFESFEERLLAIEERLAIGKSAPRFSKTPYKWLHCKHCSRVVFQYFNAAGVAHQIPLGQLRTHLTAWAKSSGRSKCLREEHLTEVLKAMMEAPEAILDRRMAGFGYNVWLKPGAGIDRTPPPGYPEPKKPRRRKSYLEDIRS